MSAESFDLRDHVARGHRGALLDPELADLAGAVGGGGDVRGLSNDALAWIMEGAEAEGLALNQTALATLKALSDPIAPLSNQTKPPGWVDRFLYWRGPRNGPQQKRMLSESTLARLAYEGKGEEFRAYRPETLRAVWPK